MDTASRVRDLVVPEIQAAGAELYDVELSGGLLRITIDRPGGVDLEVIGTVTRAVSRLLDDADPIAGEYTLEVTSPGLERPLRTPEHFERAVGDTVTVKTRPGVDGDRRIKGVIVSTDDQTFTVRLDGSEATRTIAYGDVERARTVFEWGPAPKPGKGSKPGARSKSPKSAPEKKAATS